ncbi:histidine phosphatase family protein [Streptococcus oricebi]|uniref:Histidine phosphatase family protein n=1 Tax=Streptococcus oricebi TaxID=1547447 RepID=A0ABS5B4Z7_9STRE|nr:histidine phosphatase family protein [Streptococcus oricebi]MBP2623880.1 histidine phosphatase family protein [Streptococcus oricebi]
MIHLYLMRHGQTYLNQDRRVQGSYDSPLTDLGQKQARKARAYFLKAGVSFDLVLSSSQERACDTAEIVSEKRDYLRLKGLKEMNFGSFEGKEEKLLPKFRPGAISFEDLLVPYGGESIEQVGARVSQTLEELLLAGPSDQTVLAVSHGAAMWAFILNQGLSIPASSRFGNLAICHLTYEQGKFDLLEVIDPLS